MAAYFPKVSSAKAMFDEGLKEGTFRGVSVGEKKQFEKVFGNSDNFSIEEKFEGVYRDKGILWDVTIRREYQNA